VSNRHPRACPMGPRGWPGRARPWRREGYFPNVKGCPYVCGAFLVALASAKTHWTSASVKLMRRCSPRSFEPNRPTVFSHRSPGTASPRSYCSPARVRRDSRQDWRHACNSCGVGLRSSAPSISSKKSTITMSPRDPRALAQGAFGFVLKCSHSLNGMTQPLILHIVSCANLNSKLNLYYFRLH